VVIGRSNIVGKPMAMMLCARKRHSSPSAQRDQGLAASPARLDVVVAAVGSATSDGGHGQAGAVIIDVGRMNERKRQSSPAT